MRNFDLQAYLAELDASQSIDDCTKVPRPELGESQNYIFISYAHADYKKVYAALAYMYEKGVRFWYDDGLTAGKSWEKEAKERIRDPKCSGAIFFLSNNLFLSNSVIKVELPCILGVDEKGDALEGVLPLNYFCVNLTENNPSDIIFDVFAELRSRGHGTTWLKLLSTAFPDEMTYISSNERDYESKLLEQIRKCFNVVDSDFDVNAPIYVGEKKDGRYHGKGRLIYPETDIRESFSGSFENGEMCGFGMLRYRNGDKYEGEWKNGKYEGFGILTLVSGKTFEGEFKNGDICGYCVYLWVDGSVSYHYMGDWVDGKPHGYGIKRYVSDELHEDYDGEWRNGKREGFGINERTTCRPYASDVYERTIYRPYASEIYEGDWANDLRNGYGIMHYADDDAYYGAWVDDLKCGFGVYVGEKGRYKGDWANDLENGYGEMRYIDGDIYRGDWLDGAPHGVGKMTFNVNDIRDYYEGEFVNGAMQGSGILAFKNGDRYEGGFENGKMQGKGKYVYADGVSSELVTQSPNYSYILRRNNRIYEGEFKNGLREGEGVLINSHTNSVIYRGVWKNDLPDGRGYAVFPDHTCYEGDWMNGLPHGYGVNRDTIMDDIYTGEWRDGKREGKGTEYFNYPNGERYEGEFKNDLRNGYGVRTYPDGRVEKGIWANGKLVEKQ